MKLTIGNAACILCFLVVVVPSAAALAGTAEKIEADTREAAAEIREEAIEAKDEAVETGIKIKDSAIEAGKAVKEGAVNVGHEIRKTFQETKEAITESVSGGHSKGADGQTTDTQP